MKKRSDSEIVKMFYDRLSGWDYDSWRSAGRKDIEDIVTEVVSELEITDNEETLSVFELFYDWSACLSKEDFE